MGPYFGLPSLETHACYHLVSKWDCIPVSEMTGNLGQIISITVFPASIHRFSFPPFQLALSTKIQQDDMHRLHRWPPSPRAARWYSMIFNDIHRWSPTPTAALSSKIAFQLNLLTGFKCCISKHFGANICFLFPTIKVWGRCSIILWGVGCHLITKVCHYNTQSEGPRGWVVRVQ